jgi:hypothetical protein
VYKQYPIDSSADQIMTVLRRDSSSLASHDSTDVTQPKSILTKSMDSSPNVAALLLTNVATIASNELNHSVLIKPLLFDPSKMTPPATVFPHVVPGELTCVCLHHDYSRDCHPSTISYSEDDENHSTADSSLGGSAVLCQPILPTSSDQSPSPILSSTQTNLWNDECITQNPRVVRRVLSKKFTWKNYPELEEFLIANREEYLRHSALNYSAKQKHFNNKLTEQVLELATQHGYVFQNFSFVMLRDKIRCYYKSYLQALRKKQQKKER